jgi:hypothetical protein
MSVTSQLRRYLHALLFIALATVILSVIGFLVNSVPDRSLNIGEKTETYTETAVINKYLLFSVTCENINGCTFVNYEIPSTCTYAEFDYSQCTALSSYRIVVHNGFTEEYYAEPGSIFILNHTGVLVDFKAGGWETVNVYCAQADIVTYTTTVGAVQVSTKEILSYVYFAVTIVVVIAGIRKFLPQF